MTGVTVGKGQLVLANGLLVLQAEGLQALAGYPPSELRSLYRETLGIAGKELTKAVEATCDALQRPVGFAGVREVLKAVRDGHAVSMKYTKRGELRLSSHIYRKPVDNAAKVAAFAKRLGVGLDADKVRQLTVGV